MLLRKPEEVAPEPPPPRQKRHRSKAARDGTIAVYRGGSQWKLPRQQFQALYTVVGTFEEALELQPSLVPWPTDDPLIAPPTVQDIWTWTRAIDNGDDLVDPQILKRMDERIMRKFKADVRKGIVVSSRALQYSAKKLMDGSITEGERLSILPLGQAVNYGVGNYANLEKATTVQTSVNLQGRWNFDAGANPFAPPKRDKVNRSNARWAKNRVLEAEYKEAPADGDAG